MEAAKNKAANPNVDNVKSKYSADNNRLNQSQNFEPSVDLMQAYDRIRQAMREQKKKSTPTNKVSRSVDNPFRANPATRLNTAPAEESKHPINLSTQPRQTSKEVKKPVVEERSDSRPKYSFNLPSMAPAGKPTVPEQKKPAISEPPSEQKTQPKYSFN